MANDYYNVTGAPVTGSQGLSSLIRAEYSNIASGFNKLPPMTGFGAKAVIVNTGGTALTTTVGSLALAGNFTTTGAYSVTLAFGAAMTVSFPVVSGLTLATLTGTETLTNKTLTAPVLTTPSVSNPAFSGTSTGSLTLVALTAPSPVISGTITGTYTIGGTPTGSLISVLATGTSSARTLAARFDEMVNPYDYGAIGDGVTSDQTAVANATADAFAAGKQMYWPLGTFLTTATIPNFHSIRHFGPGIVKRGSTLFYVTQKVGLYNTMYVATTGNDANDGLSSSEPILTLNRAVTVTESYAPLQFKWTIELAAGTYSENVTLSSGTSFNEDYLIIQGPTPTPGTAAGATTNSAGYAIGVTTVTLASAGTGSLIVGDVITFAGDTTYYRITSGDADVSNGGPISFTPYLHVTIGAAPVAITRVSAPYWDIPTAIIDSPGVGLVGLDLQQGNRVKLRNLKFTDFVSPAVYAVTGDLNTVLYAENVHAANCRYGIIVTGGQLYVQGGIFDGYPSWTTGARPAGGGERGVSGYSGSTVSIGYAATNEITGTIIEKMESHGYEGKTNTHCVGSWVSFLSNNIAEKCYSNSRFDSRHNIYKKNTLCHQQLASTLVNDTVLGTSEYHEGETFQNAPYTVGDGNNFINHFLHYSNEEIDVHPLAIGGLDICHQRTSTLQTGTITSTLTRLLCTIFKGSFHRSGSATFERYLEVFLCGASTGAAGTKTVLLTLGGITISTLTIAAGTQTWTAHVTIWSSNATSVVQITEAVNATSGAVRSAPGTIDVWVDNALEVFTAIPGAADTATLHEARVIRWG